MSDETPAETAAPETATADGGEAVLSDEAIAALAATAPDDPAPAEGEEPAKDEKPDGEKPAEEKPPETAAKPVDEAQRLRHLGAKLARRNARLTEREERIKAVEQKAAFVDQLSHLSRTDKLAALKALGINEDEIVDAVLARQTQADRKPPTAEERVAELERKLAEKDKAEQAATQGRQLQAQYDSFRAEQIAKIEAAPGLDRVKSGKLYDDVMANMGAYHAKHGVIPDPVVVARYIEAAERVREELEKEDSPVTGAPKTKTPPPTSKAKNSAAPSPSLTDRISDTVGDDGLPDDPDERLKVAWARLNS